MRRPRRFIEAHQPHTTGTPGRARHRIGGHASWPSAHPNAQRSSTATPPDEQSRLIGGLPVRREDVWRQPADIGCESVLVGQAGDVHHLCRGPQQLPPGPVGRRPVGFHGASPHNGHALPVACAAISPARGVFPMPGSPRHTTSRGSPASAASRHSPRTSSSRCRPTNSVRTTGLLPRLPPKSTTATGSFGARHGSRHGRSRRVALGVWRRGRPTRLHSGSMLLGDDALTNDVGRVP